MGKVKTKVLSVEPVVLMLPVQSSLQYCRSWDWRKTGDIPKRRYKPIWDLKWAAVLGGRQYWEGGGIVREAVL